jgi:hypothetical protein
MACLDDSYSPEERQQRSDELRNSRAFDFTLWSDYPEFDSLIGRVLAELPDSKKGKDFQYLKVLLANLYDLHRRHPDKWLAISRDNSAYSKFPKRYNHLLLGYRSASRVMDALERSHFIKQQIGFYDKQKKFGFRTRIRPDTRLIEAFALVKHIKDLITDHTGSESILLKSKKNGRGKFKTPGELLDYADTPDTKLMRFRLGAINCLLKELNLELHGEPDSPKIYKRRMYRVFNNGTFDDGGRFYGGCWQQLDKEERRRLTINNSFVEELDYKGFHIRMLYDLKGIDIGDDDPYMIPGLDPNCRDFFKLAVLILINANSRTAAIEAIRNEARTEHPQFADEVDKLIDTFINHHHRIGEYFYSGYGVKLQRIDSNIIEAIIYELSLRGIPVLPVHDSIVVPIGYRDIVTHAMNEAYRRELGTLPRIDVASSWRSFSKVKCLQDLYSTQ